MPLRATSKQLDNITGHVQVVMDLAPAIVRNMCCTAHADGCIGAQQPTVLFAFAYHPLSEISSACAAEHSFRQGP